MLHHGDLADGVMLVNLMRDIEPGEVYHLGAQSHVKVSFEMPEYTGDVTGVGTIRLLEAIRASGVDTRFYQASSSEMFGSTPPPQNEDTPFHPRSPYGCAKVYAYWATVNYREAYGLHATNGILFNHESPRRGETFVTRKITRAVARIAAGIQDALYLGNLDAVRDWGYAKEYVEAQWLMLQQPDGDDYVVATGEAATVRDFCEAAFARAGLDWEKYVRTDARYERPSEVDALIGDASKAQQQARLEGDDRLARARRADGRRRPASCSRTSSPASSCASTGDRRGGRSATTFPLDAPFYVAGHRGLVGSAVWRHLEQRGHTRPDRPHQRRARPAGPPGRGRLLRRGSARSTSSWPPRRSAASSPTRTYPADFLSDNLRIQVNVLDAAARTGVRRLLFLGSSCIYPKYADQPIREDSLLTGPLEPTNDAYAIAKIAGVLHVQALRRQHGVVVHLRDADQPLRLERQLRSRDIPRAAGAGPQVRRGQAGWRAVGRAVGHRARRGASSCGSTTWPGPASPCWSGTTSRSRSTSASART